MVANPFPIEFGGGSNNEGELYAAVEWLYEHATSGPQGPMGPAGTSGIQGPQGATGETGPPGPSPTATYAVGAGADTTYVNTSGKCLFASWLVTCDHGMVVSLLIGPLGLFHEVDRWAPTDATVGTVYLRAVIPVGWSYRLNTTAGPTGSPTIGAGYAIG